MKMITLAAIGALAAAAVIVTAGADDPAKETRQMANKQSSCCSAPKTNDASTNDQSTCLSPEQIEQMAKDLSPEERRIILEKGTERAFTGELYNNKKEGVYMCRLCGAPLFSSETKYESGSGWPSFYQPMDDGAVGRNTDASAGMVRNEIVCANCQGHLGHVFNDGPKPTGERYCVNSASLKFITKDEFQKSQTLQDTVETAYFAGGCFWGVEDRFQNTTGVIDAVSGYMGGKTLKPDYRSVCSGTTGHAETVRVTYDPQRVSYRELLELFFKIHEPTQLNRQGPDVGTQYRSAIFAADDEQLRMAREYIKTLENGGNYGGRPIATQVTPAESFYAAEDYHQDYHAKHGGSCSIPLTGDE